MIKPEVHLIKLKLKLNKQVNMRYLKLQLFQFKSPWPKDMDFTVPKQ